MSIAQVSIKVDVEPIKRRLNAIATGLGDRAVTRALNRTADGSKTEMSRMIRETYNISAALVRERLSVRHATRKGIATFSATLVGNPVGGGKKRSMNVIAFLERKVTIAEARRRSKSGTLTELRFKIRKFGGKQTIQGAFILPVPGSPVFRRIGPARKDIEHVQTIGVPQMFSTKLNVGRTKAWLIREFPRILQSEVKYYLSTVH